MKRIALVFSLLMLLLGSFLTGCVQQPSISGLKVVATTTIVGDIARQIGGEPHLVNGTAAGWG